MKRIIAFVILFALVLPLLGCGAKEQTPTIAGKDLLEGIAPDNILHNVEFDPTPGYSGMPGFGVRLLQASLQPGENTLISPLSLFYALAMTGNGARGETLQQMETVLGMPVASLNPYLEGYSAQITQNQGSLKLANSIWFTDDKRFAVEKPFLQTVADYYDAGIYQVPFDEVTCRDINAWVKEKTDGMIPQILDQIPDDAVIALDIGTSVYELSRLLGVKKNLSIITNSLHTAVMLGAYPNLQVYCIGGNVKHDNITVVTISK